MWKLLGTPKVVRITKKLAEEFRDMTPSPGDRNLSDKRRSRLQSHVTKHTMRPCVWAKVYCKADSKTYRVNGQHTSTVMAEANGEAKGLFAFVELYEADSLEDVASLYSTFDARFNSRSQNDLNRSFSHSVETLDDIPGPIINVAISGLSFALWGESGSAAAAPETRAALIPANAGFILWLHDRTSELGKDIRIVKRAPITAAMYRTYEKDKKAATEFWDAVIHGSGSDFRSPDRKLHKYLLGTAIRSSSTERQRAGRREMYVKALHAWNAWRRGASSDLKFFANAEDPKVI